MGFSCGLSTEKAVQYKYAEKIMQRLFEKSIDNLETQKKSISMKNSQFFDYLLYAKSK
jgi:hypothetical protein